MASVYLSAKSNAVGASEVVLINGEPSTTGYRLLNVDVGNASFDKQYSGPRGTLGAVLAGETAQNRLSTFRLQAVGTSADDLQAKLSVLWALDEQLRHHGGTVTWRPQGGSYRMKITALDTGVTLEPLEPALFVLNNRANVAFGVVSGPYYEGESMDVLDDFSADTKANYTFDSGAAGDVAVSGGALTASANLTTEKRMIHTDRGYSYGDVQLTLKATPGSTITSYLAGVILKRVDASNYLRVYVDDNGVNSRLRIDKVVASSVTNLATTNLGARVSNGTAFWVRGRIEGNALYAEYFTAAPYPMLAATTSTSYTLTAGAEVNTFGAAISGKVGIDWTPQQSAATLDDFAIESFAYRGSAGVTLPAVLSPAGTIPGDAPALGSFALSIGAPATSIYWAMVSWWAPFSPGAYPSVIGIIEAESAWHSDLWSSSADANYRGGNGLKRTTAGAESLDADWQIGAGTVVPDDYRGQEIDVEVWARVEIASTLVSPMLTLSVSYSSGSRRQYTPEYGTSGKALVKPSSGTAFRFVRLGTLTIPTVDLPGNIRLVGSVAVGSTGQFGLDYLVIVPARSRVLGPTGKPAAGYPIFFPASNITKVVTPDHAGALSLQADVIATPDAGLGGSLIEIPPGQVQLLAKLSSLVPDDPTSDTSSERLAETAVVQLRNVIPRWRVVRSS